MYTRVKLFKNRGWVPGVNEAILVQTGKKVFGAEMRHCLPHSPERLSVNVLESGATKIVNLRDCYPWQEIRTVEVKSPEERSYVNVQWRPEDVRTLRPTWTRRRATAWLKRNGKAFRDELTTHGWQIMEALLNEH